MKHNTVGTKVATEHFNAMRITPQSETDLAKRIDAAIAKPAPTICPDALFYLAKSEDEVRACMGSLTKMRQDEQPIAIAAVVAASAFGILRGILAQSAANAAARK